MLLFYAEAQLLHFYLFMILILGRGQNKGIDTIDMLKIGNLWDFFMFTLYPLTGDTLTFDPEPGRIRPLQFFYNWHDNKQITQYLSAF